MGGALATCGDCALAQITPDGTLGAESSVVTPTNIDGLPTQQIDGGATRGANLFHSFDPFSVIRLSTSVFRAQITVDPARTSTVIPVQYCGSQFHPH